MNFIDNTINVSFDIRIFKQLIVVFKTIPMFASNLVFMELSTAVLGSTFLSMVVVAVFNVFFYWNQAVVAAMTACTAVRTAGNILAQSGLVFT